MIRSFRKGGGGGKRKDDSRKPLETGLKVRDRGNDRNGVILDSASQYTHPQAPPIFNYLIRWQDGQVQAVSEAAFRGGHGIEIVD